MTIRPGYTTIPETAPREDLHRAMLARALNGALLGRINCITSVTLAPGATATTLADPRLGAFSVVLLMPETANAAVALSEIYVSGRQNGQCVINHAANAATDRSFAVAILG